VSQMTNGGRSTMTNKFIADRVERASPGEGPANGVSAQPRASKPAPADARKAPAKRQAGVSRRDLIGNLAKSAGVACLAAVALDQYIHSARATDAKALRPP